MTNSSEIHVLSSLATREAYLELTPQFERDSGHKISTTWAGTVDIKKRIATGEVFDLIIASSTLIDELIGQGKVKGGRVDLAKTGIGVAVRAGAPKPDISSGAALKQAVLAARSIGFSTGPSGVYLLGLFERLGIAQQVKAKTRQVPSGQTVAPIVASGEAEIGFQQVSELVHAPGIDYLGPLPPDAQYVTVFSAGIHAQAPNPGAASELLNVLTSKKARQTFQRHGLEVA